MERNNFGSKYPSIQIEYNPTEEPLILNKQVMDILMREEEYPNLLTFYLLIYYTNKWKNFPENKITIEYMANKLKWSIPKVRRIKKRLVELKLISIGEIYNNDNIFTGHSIHINFYTEPYHATIGAILKNDFINKIRKKKVNNIKNTIPPSLKEVEMYCKERDNGINAQTFIDFYQAKGWLIGKNKMKDWQAAIRTWERNNNNNSPSTKGMKPFIIDDGRKYNLCSDGRYRNISGDIFIE